jgi:CubicO group peptidase (beta-lactamase class C family)
LVSAAKNVVRRAGTVSLMAATAQPSTSTAPGIAERIDELFARWDADDTPGCALGVIRAGELVHEAYVGMADLEHGIRHSADSVFDIASTSKQFTAAAVLLLHQRGELSLDDEVQAYVPELPDYGDPITLRHLVHHTSGLRDYLALRLLAGLHDNDYFDMQDALDLIARQRNLNFTPGGEHLYSNSGYVLLAIIVSRVTGISFGEWCGREIFTPLRMSRSRFREDVTAIVPGMVQSYARRDEIVRKVIPNDDGVGDGGLLTTLRDLVLWERNYIDEHVGGAGFTATMSTPGTPETADERYAFGLAVGEYRGLETVSHGGNLYGYSGQYLRFPDQQLAIVCLSNLGGFDAPGLSRRVADVVLEDVLAPADGRAAADHGDTANQDEATGPAVSPDDLASLPGLYRQETGLAIEVVARDDALCAVILDKEVPLRPLAEHTFATIFQDIALDVIFDVAGGKATGVRFDHEGDTLLRASSIEPVDVATLDLAQYTGHYRSDELLIDATVTLEHGALCVRRGRANRDVLRATLPDQFALPFGGLEFTRADDGVVDGFLLSMSRTSGVRFRTLSN